MVRRQGAGRLGMLYLVGYDNKSIIYLHSESCLSPQQIFRTDGPTDGIRTRHM